MLRLGQKGFGAWVLGRIRTEMGSHADPPSRFVADSFPPFHPYSHSRTLQRMVSLPTSVSSASPRTLITASVVLSSTLTALSIVSFQALRRKSLRESLRKDVALSLTKDDLRIQHDGYPEPDGRDAQLLADGGIMQVDGRDGGSDAAGQTGGKKKKFSEELVREQVRLFFSLLGVLAPCAVESGEGRRFSPRVLG